MENFVKVIRIGKIKYEFNKSIIDIFCKIKYIDSRLFISGVEGPLKSGDCEGSCGQINKNWENDECIEYIQFAKNWDKELFEKFSDVWENYHLNFLIAGSPEQEKFLAKHEKDYKIMKGQFDSYYTWACFVLKSANLYLDPNYFYNGKPYAYGNAWLSKEIPLEILEFLKSLPNTDKQPVWV